MRDDRFEKDIFTSAQEFLNRFPRGEAVERSETEEECGRCTMMI